MTDYKPDNWVVIRFKGDDPHYRVLAGWSGGYFSGNSWRMNSGITRSEFDGDYWYFYGSSGSCYKCHVDSYMLKTNNIYVWKQLQKYMVIKLNCLMIKRGSKKIGTGLMKGS